MTINQDPTNVTRSIQCEWCGKPLISDIHGFCSDWCQKAWFDQERQFEFAYEAMQDALAESAQEEDEPELTWLDVL